jgi:hypothetical protein
LSFLWRSIALDWALSIRRFVRVTEVYYRILQINTSIHANPVVQ